MALRAVCPECGTTETLADDYAANTVECRRCHNVFATPTTQIVASAAPTQQAPRPPALPTPAPTTPDVPVEPGFDLVEDDAPTPTKKPAPVANKDSSPRPRGSVAPAKKNSPVVVIMLAVVALIVGGGSAGSAAYMLRPNLAEGVVAKNDPPGFSNPDNKPIFKKDNEVPLPPPPPSKDVPPVPTASDALSVYATTVNAPYTSLDLRGKTTDACAGAAGRLLFFFVPTNQQIVVVDVCEAKIRKALPTVSANIRMAATMDKLFVVDAETRQAERYDLRTLEKDLAVQKLPGSGTVVAVAAGCASPGPLLVSNSELDLESGRALTFLDPKFEEAGFVWEARGERAQASDGRGFVGLPNLRCTPNGVEWYCSEAAPLGAGPARVADVLYMERRGINAVDFRVYELSAGIIAPTEGGRLYTRQVVYSSNPARRESGPLFNQAQRIYPPVVGPFSLMLLGPAGPGPKGIGTSPTGTRTLKVLDETDGNIKDPKMATTAKVVPSPLPQGADPLPWDREVFYVPVAEVIALVNGSRDRLELTTYRTEAATSGLVEEVALSPMPKNAFVCGVAPNTFTPGQPYEHQIMATKALTDTRFFTMSGDTFGGHAEGFEVSKAGRLTWAAPADYKDPYITFDVSLYARGSYVVRQKIIAFNTAIRKAPLPKSKDPMPMPKPKDPTPNPKDPTPMPPVIPTDFAPGVKLVKAATTVPTLTPVDFAGPSTTVGAPGPIVDLCVGGAGRYLLVHVPTARKVSVFDVCTTKFVGALKTEEDNVLLAAGATKALLVYPDKKRVERWDLASFTKETEKVLDVKQTITAIGMGNATAGPLVLGGPKAQNNASKMSLMFLDIDTLKEVKIDGAEGKFGVTFGAPAHLRVSSNGKLISAWFKDAAPSGVQMVELTDNSLRGVYVSENAGQVVASADAKFVGTNLGMFLPNTERSGPPTDVVLPAVQKGGFLVLTPAVANHYRKVTVVPETGDPLGSYENLPSYDGKRDPFEREATPLTLDQRILFVPDAKALIVIPPAANKLHVFKVPPTK